MISLMISLCLLLFSQLLYAYLKQKVDGKDTVHVFIFSLFLKQKMYICLSEVDDPILPIFMCKYRPEPVDDTFAQKDEGSPDLVNEGKAQ